MGTRELLAGLPGKGFLLELALGKPLTFASPSGIPFPMKVIDHPRRGCPYRSFPAARSRLMTRFDLHLDTTIGAKIFLIRSVPQFSLVHRFALTAPQLCS